MQNRAVPLPILVYAVDDALLVLLASFVLFL